LAFGHSPVPANGADLVNYVTNLSWYSPEQDKNGATLDDPNIVSVTGYDVSVTGYDVWLGPLTCM
jgi:hypothetical protein